MAAGIYAIRVNGCVVYVGRSRDLEQRITAHLSHLKNGRDLAARYPEVFRGKIATIQVLEEIEIGEPRSSAWPDVVRWRDEASSLLGPRERHYIKQFQPSCNRTGRNASGKDIDLKNPDSMTVSCPA